MISDEQLAQIEAAFELIDSACGETWRYMGQIINARQTLTEVIDKAKAERAERKKPIDAEWLESIGFKVPKPTGFFSADTSDEDVSVFFDDGTLDTVQINWSSLRHITTRGQLLDLLAMLKGKPA